MNGQFFKVVARHQGFIGGGASMYRIVDIRNGQHTDTSIARIYNDLGEKLFAGRCFVPSSLDYPVLEVYDGDKYKLPIVNMRTGDCVENDMVIVLAELVRGNEVVGYRVTDYAGGLTDLTLQDAIGYAHVGFWNGLVEGRGIKPLGKYVFPQLVV
jgi:hypothetical protein